MLPISASSSSAASSGTQTRPAVQASGLTRSFTLDRVPASTSTQDHAAFEENLGWIAEQFHHDIAHAGRAATPASDRRKDKGAEPPVAARPSPTEPFDLRALQAKTLYERGLTLCQGLKGMPKDEVGAVRCFQEAIAHGSHAAKVSLGVCYQGGLGGLPRDARKARSLYEEAVQYGEPTGKTCLGAMYEEGSGGVKRNLETAVRLYREAHAQGDPQAKRYLQRMMKLP